MTVDQLLEAAGERDCHLTRRAATSWVSAGLLPPLHSRGRGQARGRSYSWAEPDIVDRAEAGSLLLGMRSRLVFAVAGLWYAGFRVDPAKARRALLLEAERARASVPKEARRFYGREAFDRIGALAGRIADRMAPEQGWDPTVRDAASDLGVQWMGASAGLAPVDVDDAAGLIKKVFAGKWGGADDEGSSAIAVFMARLIDALSPPRRIRILKRATTRDLQRAHRYWRAGMLLLGRLGRLPSEQAWDISLDDRLKFSIMVGSGIFPLLLDVVMRGGEPRLRRTFLLFVAGMREVFSGEAIVEDRRVDLAEIWRGWEFRILDELVSAFRGGRQ